MILTNRPEGARAAPTNIRPDDCPCIFADLRVLFKVNALNAGKVQAGIGKLYVCKRIRNVYEEIFRRNQMILDFPMCVVYNCINNTYSGWLGCRV